MGSLDDTVNLERIATALAKIANAFDQYNILCRERLNREFPPEKPKRAPEVIATETERREQFSDQATEEWMRETERALATPRPEPDQPSRFQQRFNETDAAHKPTPPRRRRVVTVPEVH